MVTGKHYAPLQARHGKKTHAPCAARRTPKDRARRNRTSRAGRTAGGNRETAALLFWTGIGQSAPQG